MDVRFRTRRLERCFEREAEAYRTWGQVVGRRYLERIFLIMATSVFDGLYQDQRLDLHPLTGNRRGLYTLRLTGQWRLLISRENNIVVIEEVSNHYGD